MKPLFASLLYVCMNSVICSAQERITLLFVGDLMQHRAQIEAARQADGTYDYAPCFAAVEADIRRADLAIGNFEVTAGGAPYTGYPAFSAPDEYLHAVHRAGFDVLLTANNHCLDRGAKGLVRTIALMDSLAIPHAGTYLSERQRSAAYPLLIEKKGFRIALLNYTYGTNGISVKPPYIVNYIDREVMQRDIRRARAMRPDVIIACMHWGVEYQRLPDGGQRDLARWLLEQGVDHVIGSHPHVVQPAEICTRGLDDHVIVYSLGNYISNMSAPDTDGGMAVTLELEKVPAIWPVCRLRSCGYSLVWTARPHLTGRKNFELMPVNDAVADTLPEAARSKMLRFASRTRSLLDKYNKGICESSGF